MLDLAREAAAKAALYPAAYNAANEAAVEAFVQNRIRFLDIFDAVYYTLGKDFNGEITIDSVFEADKAARKYALENYV
jgi:1-deoxy-D-xylulose-5-phosphate reductoisomerase